ncbi:unnamed protein product [Schistocephalus solidus]|uniref:Secreted protein n=1 Tax=Schistocephalus solidus TaxID=70667 RepID=A0A183SQN1_SCHSO|nr:unnamed protein product [Schistocephalus solidus]
MRACVRVCMIQHALQAVLQFIPLGATSLPPPDFPSAHRRGPSAAAQGVQNEDSLCKPGGERPSTLTAATTSSPSYRADLTQKCCGIVVSAWPGRSKLAPAAGSCQTPGVA